MKWLPHVGIEPGTSCGVCVYTGAGVRHKTSLRCLYTHTHNCTVASSNPTHGNNSNKKILRKVPNNSQSMITQLLLTRLLFCRVVSSNPTRYTKEFFFLNENPVVLVYNVVIMQTNEENDWDIYWCECHMRGSNSRPLKSQYINPGSTIHNRCRGHGRVD